MARLSFLDLELCKGGCQKKVSNRNGYCRDCRKLVCKRCGKEDSWKDYPRDICAKCEAKMNRKSKEMLWTEI